MRQCLKRLIEEGMEVADFEEAYQRLLLLNAISPSSKEALKSLMDEAGFPFKKAFRALDELTAPLPSDFTIQTTPDSPKILTYFCSLCPVALVTGGHPPFQLEKIEKAGLDSSIFSRIAIPEDSVKRPAYEALAKEFSTDEIWVCGDRIETDLKPARALGFKTVHMRWGRGKQVSADWVDHTISTLTELKGLIK